MLTPFVVAFAYSALLTFKPTRAVALEMADENHLVELLTFVLLLAGGVYGPRLAIRARRRPVEFRPPTTRRSPAASRRRAAVEARCSGRWPVSSR